MNIDKPCHRRLVIIKNNKLRGFNGFTIAELLVVIVVIGILAAITIVSYAGISRRANIAAIEADLSTNSKTLKMYSAEHGSYPSSLDENNCPTLPVASTRYCLKTSSNSTLSYSGSGANFSLSIAKNGLAYYTTNNTAISAVMSPTLTNNTAASINTTSATIGGTVFANGGANITSYGVCYGLTPNPTNCTEIEQGSLTAMSPATIATTEVQKKIETTSDGKNVYTIGQSGVIRMFSRNAATNELTALTPATINTGDFSGKDLVISPDGKFVYAFSTHVSSSAEIYMFSRSESNGQLAPLTPNKQFVWSGGSGSPSMLMSKDGNHLYVVYDNKIYGYARDAATGLLSAIANFGLTIINEIALSPDGLYMYIASVDASNNGRILSYARNTTSGVLTYSSVSTIGNNINPKGISISSDGKFLYTNLPANGIIRQYSRNTTNGQLTALAPDSIVAGTTERIELSIDDKTLYASDNSRIRMYSRNATTGLLTAFATPFLSTNSADIFMTPDNKGLYSANTASTIGMFNRSSGAAEGDVFTKAITGLTSGTTYYYRTFSTNSAGTSYSTDSTFTTP